MAWRPPIMKHRPTSRRRRSSTRSVLRLLDLEHSKTAVLNSLTSQDAQRGYRHAIDEFVDWYCSEPRLAFNRIVVLRYRSHLESRQLAPGTVNLRLGAVRRLAYEAADCGLLSADLAAGIRRVKGVKKLGVRLRNWLTAAQGQALWQAPDRERLKGKRDRALLAILLACGLRRHEAVALTLDHLQQREEHWAIVDLMGKGGHVRTVPVPDWVKSELEVWLFVGSSHSHPPKCTLGATSEFNLPSMIALGSSRTLDVDELVVEGLPTIQESAHQIITRAFFFSFLVKS